MELLSCERYPNYGANRTIKAPSYIIASKLAKPAPDIRRRFREKPAAASICSWFCKNSAAALFVAAFVKKRAHNFRDGLREKSARARFPTVPPAF